MAFYGCWLVAPGVGFLYARSLAEHLELEDSQIRWILYGYLGDLATTLICGGYTLFTGKAALFSHSPPQNPSLIMQHIGGHFSPNLITVGKTIYISALVLLSAVFFSRKVLERKPVDISLLAGVILTSLALIAELVLYVIQWPMGFSVLPLSEPVEYRGCDW